MNIVLLVLVAIIGVYVWMNFKEPEVLDEFEEKLRAFFRGLK